MRVKSVCVSVCLCVRLLLLNRYLDFDGNCGKFTGIVRSNYSAYFDVPVRWEVPVRGRKWGELAILAILTQLRLCARGCEVSDYARAAGILAIYLRAVRALACPITLAPNGYAYLV